MSLSLFPLLYFVSILVALWIALKSARNQFLPMAKPIAILACLLVCVFIRHLFVYQYFTVRFAESESVIRWWWLLSTSLQFAMLPMWVWIIDEFRLNTKLAFKRYWFLWVEPAVAQIYIAYHDLFTPRSNLAELSSIAELLGPYYSIHRTYMLLLGGAVLLWSLNVVRRKITNSWVSLIQLSVCMATPMLLFTAYRDGYIALPLGASSLILLLVWAARQSNLLDVIPLALSGAVQELHAGVLVLNAQDKLVYANSFAKKAFGIQPQSGGFPHSNLPLPIVESFDFKERKLQAALITIESSPRYFESTLSPLFNDKTQLFLGHIILCHDITALKIADEKLKQVNQQLRDLDHHKSTFYTGVSHEFRTPLTLSLGVLNDITSGSYGTVDKSLLGPLAVVDSNNQRLLKLVNQLLELSELDANARVIDPQKFDLVDELHLIVANFQSHADSQGIAIEVCTKGDKPHHYIEFDQNSFTSIMTNLISNGLKSMHDGGLLKIGCVDAGDDHYLITVQDSGHGIPDTLLPYILEPFYKHEITHDAWPAGVGVGLSLVSKLLELHGAQLQVQSVVNEGTIFTLRLNKSIDLPTSLPSSADSSKKSSNNNDFHYDGKDAKRASTHDNIRSAVRPSAINAPDNDSRPDALTKGGSEQKLVLVVEDNVQMRSYIRRHLGVEFRLIEAADGEEGVALAQQTIPDLILTDYMMPSISGVQLTEKIKASNNTSHIPVLMLTARSSKQDKLSGYEAGVDDFLTKPFDVSELLLRINNLITSREQLRDHYLRSFNTNNLNSNLNPSADQVGDNLFDPLAKKENQFLQSLRTYVLKEVANTDIRVADLADLVNMSERSLGRKLNALAGISPSQLIQEIRLNYASNLLINTELQVTKVAYMSGFSDSGYFTKVFKQRYSQTPKRFRSTNSPDQ